MGLMDYFIPIRSTLDSTQAILAVLIVGHYRPPEETALNTIHNRVDEITTGNDWGKYFPGLNLENRSMIGIRLHGLVEKIPIINNEWEKRIESSIKEAVSLMEIIATRTLHRSILIHGEEFIQNLGLDKANVNLGEKALWNEVEKALSKILNHFNFDSAILYASSYNDYTDLKCQVVLPPSITVPGAVGLKSYESFLWLSKQNMIILPISLEGFSWFNPKTYFSADSAIIFSREMPDGHIIIIGFGVKNRRMLNAFQKSILYEAINNKLFRFIENALFGIALDHLMVEAGHLMGRAYGKVAAGKDQLKKIEPLMEIPGQEDILQQSFWAIEDGVTRLELIRSNFYSFRAQRLIGVDDHVDFEEKKSKTGTGDRNLPLVIRKIPHTENVEKLDVVTVLNGLKNFLDRSVKDTKLKSIQYDQECKGAIILGPTGSEDKLRLVFLNLFDNAMKFAYEGTFVKIEIKKSDNKCIIHFINLGVGVAPDEFERVFRPLLKSRFKDSKRTEGIGLGLSYCRRIIEEEFKGNICLKSWPVHTPNPRRFDGDNWLTKVTVELEIFKEE